MHSHDVILSRTEPVASVTVRPCRISNSLLVQERLLRDEAPARVKLAAFAVATSRRWTLQDGRFFEQRDCQRLLNLHSDAS